MNPPRVPCKDCGQEFYDGDAPGDYMGEGVYVRNRSLNNKSYGKLCNACWGNVLKRAFPNVAEGREREPTR